MDEEYKKIEGMGYRNMRNYIGQIFAQLEDPLFGRSMRNGSQKGWSEEGNEINRTMGAEKENKVTQKNEKREEDATKGTAENKEEDNNAVDDTAEPSTNEIVDYIEGMPHAEHINNFFVEDLVCDNVMMKLVKAVKSDEEKTILLSLHNTASELADDDVIKYTTHIMEMINYLKKGASLSTVLNVFKIQDAVIGDLGYNADIIDVNIYKIALKQLNTEIREKMHVDNNSFSRRICLAKKRDGSFCTSYSVKGKTRCRMHGCG